MEKKPFRVYVLEDPITEAIRYVGITSQAPAKRLAQHCTILRGTPHKKNWIRALKNQGLKPSIRILFEGLSSQEACKIEFELIREYRKILGKTLLNVCDEHTPFYAPATRPKSTEHKQKISQAHLGQKKPWVSQRNKKISSKPVQIKNLITGEILQSPSIVEAARMTQMCKDTVLDILRGDKTSWKNYSFSLAFSDSE